MDDLVESFALKLFSLRHTIDNESSATKNYDHKVHLRACRCPCLTMVNCVFTVNWNATDNGKKHGGN